MQVGKEKLLWMYEKMVQIRYYQENLAEMLDTTAPKARHDERL